jgi:hypothetical protein
MLVEFTSSLKWPNLVPNLTFGSYLILSGTKEKLSLLLFQNMGTSLTNIYLSIPHATNSNCADSEDIISFRNFILTRKITIVLAYLSWQALNILFYFKN